MAARHQQRQDLKPVPAACPSAQVQLGRRARRGPATPAPARRPYLPTPPPARRPYLQSRFPVWLAASCACAAGSAPSRTSARVRPSVVLPPPRTRRSVAGTQSRCRSASGSSAGAPGRLLWRLLLCQRVRAVTCLVRTRSRVQVPVPVRRGLVRSRRSRKLPLSARPCFQRAVLRPGADASRLQGTCQECAFWAPSQAGLGPALCAFTGPRGCPC